MSCARETQLVLLLVAMLGLGAPARAAIEIAGEPRAVLTWEPASGPVAGYAVYITWNGAAEASSCRWIRRL